MIAVITRMQRELEAIYGLALPWRVEDFLLGPDAPRPRRAGAAGPKEVLLVRQDEEGLQLGLYLDPSLLELLSAHDPDDPSPAVITDSLGAFTTALEGVSHFVYLAYRALRDEPVSLLDLETQAEVDKFVTSLLHLWRRGRKEGSAQLRERLFHEVRYHPELNRDEESRYRTANELARGYCRRLEARFLTQGSPEGLLREVRRAYRLGGAAKRAHLRLRAAA